MEAFQSGGIVVVRDEMHRENEGDFVLAAQHATPEAINFLLHAGRGLVCVALSGERCDELRLPLMVEDNTESMGSAFTVSVDARNGTTTGISAADRATTARLLADPTAGPEDFRRPGHVF
ncbi:MAG: 3,4-dihydroxy-2-butanone-4-phosphate synthase, partial [Armatimonadota bacterium]